MQKPTGEFRFLVLDLGKTAKLQAASAAGTPGYGHSIKLLYKETSYPTAWAGISHTAFTGD